MDDLKKRALAVRDQYRELNSLNGEGHWGYREFAEALVGDVGDLMKMLQAKANLRPYTKGDLDEDIKHELSDCIWAIIAIADDLHIDLEESFKINMDKLSKKIESKLEEHKK